MMPMRPMTHQPGQCHCIVRFVHAIFQLIDTEEAASRFYEPPHEIGRNRPLSGWVTRPDALARTYVVFPSWILWLTCWNAPDRECGFWLREPDRDGRAEQCERAVLDRGHGSDLLDLLPGKLITCRPRVARCSSRSR